MKFIVYMATSLLCLLSLTGCIGGSSPTVKYYVINPAVTKASETQSDLHVEVQTIRLPQYLERPQIVTRSDDQQIQLSESNQWGGNLRKNMSRTLSVNLSRALNTPNIAVTPHRGPVSPDYRIEVEVLKFERDADNRVRLSAQWRLHNLKSKKDTVIKITELESSTVSGTDDFGDIVNAMSALFGQLSETIASTILSQQGG